MNIEWMAYCWLQAEGRRFRRRKWQRSRVLLQRDRRQPERLPGTLSQPITSKPHRQQQNTRALRQQFLAATARGHLASTRTPTFGLSFSPVPKGRRRGQRQRQAPVVQRRDGYGAGGEVCERERLRWVSRVVGADFVAHGHGQAAAWESWAGGLPVAFAQWVDRQRSTDEVLNTYDFSLKGDAAHK